MDTRRYATTSHLPVALLCLLSVGLPAAEADPFLAGFSTPPATARPLTWWHWMDGNVTKRGITADLEAMKRVGLAGAQFFDAGLGTPATGLTSVAFRSPEWFDLVRHAAAESRRLGLELGIHSSSGWSITGGTWVKPAQAMRKLVWSETSITGPDHFRGFLPRPPDVFGPFQDAAVEPGKNEASAPWPRRDYADGAVVAWRMQTGVRRMADAKPTVSCSVAGLDVTTVVDGRLATRITLPKGTSAWVRFDFAEPFTCRAVITYAALPAGTTAVLEAGDYSDAFRTIAPVAMEQTFRHRPTRTSIVPTTTARHFRILFTGLKGSAEIGELDLGGEPRLARWEAKAGFILPKEDERLPLPTTTPVDGTAIAEVVDLTSRMAPDGTLDWECPAGDWLVLRLGHSPTGKTNGPGPAGSEGLECDKLDRAAVTAYMEGFLAPLADQLGPFMGDSFKTLLVDSWEAVSLNWTPAMRAEFARRRGYDMTPWLPVMTGRVVGDEERSERFLADVRRTIGDLLADNHYAVIDDLCRRRGLVCCAEAAGVGLAMTDQLQCKGRVAVPMGEFWHPNPGGRYDAPDNINNQDSKEAASGAHIYGKTVAATESFTSGGRHGPWQAHPFAMKAQGDFMFCKGINRFAFHTYAHQPFDDRLPGMTMGPYGFHFGRTVTWWDHGAKEWIDYIARCQFLLQQGLPHADIAVFVGEDVPAAALFTKDITRDIPSGYDYDLFNAEVLLTRMTARDGRVVLPDGVGYRVVILTGSRRMTPAVAAKLRDLVQAGVVVVGPRPAASPSLEGYPGCDTEVKSIANEMWGDCDGTTVKTHAYGAGHVFSGMSMAEVMAGLPLAPDFCFTASDPKTDLAFIHRRLGDGHAYFVSNQDSTQAVAAECSFRIAGFQPELWDATDGSRHDAVAFRQEAGRTIVPLHLDPAGSTFVVFRRAIATTVQGTATRNGSDMIPVATVTGPWTVAFDPAWGGPATVIFTTLEDWTRHPEPGIRFYSGTATYRADLELTADRVDGRTPLFLDLGAVAVTARVSLNGQVLGTLWKPPFRVDITRAVKSGTNRLEIQVANLWPNRLIGDQQLPEAQRLAHLVFPSPYKKDAPLLPSGLLGPVVVATGRGF